MQGVENQKQAENLFILLMVQSLRKCGGWKMALNGVIRLTGGSRWAMNSLLSKMEM